MDKQLKPVWNFYSLLLLFEKAPFSCFYCKSQEWNILIPVFEGSPFLGNAWQQKLRDLEHGYTMTLPHTTSWPTEMNVLQISTFKKKTANKLHFYVLKRHSVEIWYILQADFINKFNRNCIQEVLLYLRALYCSILAAISLEKVKSSSIPGKSAMSDRFYKIKYRPRHRLVWVV